MAYLPFPRSFRSEEALTLPQSGWGAQRSTIMPGVTNLVPDPWRPEPNKKPQPEIPGFRPPPMFPERNVPEKSQPTPEITFPERKERFGVPDTEEKMLEELRKRWKERTLLPDEDEKEKDKRKEGDKKDDDKKKEEGEKTEEEDDDLEDPLYKPQKKPKPVPLKDDPFGDKDEDDKEYQPGLPSPKQPLQDDGDDDEDGSGFRRGFLGWPGPQDDKPEDDEPKGPNPFFD
uniref:Uncharacterized protein n=1 Tax=Lotharella globosa TaxID=91324 RepID=A0A7S4DK47_9EUKA